MRIIKLNESIDVHTIMDEAEQKGLFNAKNVYTSR